MELIPIIYTTLQIFAGIAIVTIVGSYISYKIRKKKGLLDTEEATDILETPDIIKERFRKNIQENKSSSTSKSKPKEESSSRSRKSSSNRSEKRENEHERRKRSARDRQREHERYIQEKRIAEQKRLKEEKERQSSKDRIQVLNVLDKSTKSTEPVKPTADFKKSNTNPKKYNTLGDDIMKNYDESKDDSFKPLKTKDKKNS